MCNAKVKKEEEEEQEEEGWEMMEFVNSSTNILTFGIDC